MKRILLSVLFYLLTAQLFAQTEGISYQAVIIGPDKQELPGQDVQGNILPNAAIAIRFSIINGANAIVYQEIQTTHTDQYGRINLLIGSADPDKFTQIDWDGTAKDLKVEIDFRGGTSFVDMSRETLTFLPFAYHRNITARGTLIVNGVSDLNGELTVQGPANLNSTLNVNNKNATNLSGALNVEGHANLNNGQTVKGTTSLDSLNISGALDVGGIATFRRPAIFNEPTEFIEMNVNGPSNLRGQVTVDANMDSIGGDDNYNAYPLLVQGSDQGIAVKVNGSRSTSNNFISFWDNDQMWGRIEGLTVDEQKDNFTYKFEHGIKIADIVTTTVALGISIAEVFQKTAIKIPATFTSSTACVGLGACVTVPIPSLIVEASFDALLTISNSVLAGYDLAKAIKEEVDFVNQSNASIGVTYQSGAGDYAEWLPKLNTPDIFAPGQVVGIKDGMVTKNTWDADKIMIVSTRPIILGNMPQQNDEKNNVKIAFMGQVPVKVLGKVSPGDYILPNVLNNEFATAVHPKDMKTRDYKKVAGVAWNTIEKFSEDLSIVNVAVGINTNDLSDIVSKQEDDLMQLKKNYDQLNARVQQSNSVLANLIPGYAQAVGLTETNVIANIRAENNNAKKVDQHLTINDSQILNHDEEDVIYFQISDEQIEAAIAMARAHYVQMCNDSKSINKLIGGNNNELKKGNNSKSEKPFENIILMPIEDHPFWQKMDSDPSYVEAIKDVIKTSFERGIHTHKKYAEKFTNLKVSDSN